MVALRIFGISSLPEPLATPPNFIDLFGREPAVHVGDAGGFMHADNKIVLRRHADVLEFGGIEFDAGFAEELLQEQSADKVADGETVGLWRL